LGGEISQVGNKKKAHKGFPRENPLSWPHFKEKLVEMIIFELDVFARH
jgi:hypothetical protein